MKQNIVLLCMVALGAITTFAQEQQQPQQQEDPIEKTRQYLSAKPEDEEFQILKKAVMGAMPMQLSCEQKRMTGEACEEAAQTLYLAFQVARPTVQQKLNAEIQRYRVAMQNQDRRTAFFLRQQPNPQAQRVCGAYNYPLPIGRTVNQQSGCVQPTQQGTRSAANGQLYGSGSRTTTRATTSNGGRLYGRN